MGDVHRDQFGKDSASWRQNLNLVMRDVQRFQVVHGAGLELPDVVVTEVEAFQAAQILEKSGCLDLIVGEIKVGKSLGGGEELIGDTSDLVVVQFQVLKLD